MATYSGSDKRLAYLFQNGGGGGSSTLDGLSDVNLTTPTDGQVLAYDANADEWVNSSTANPSSIASMSDTDIQSPTDGQTLVYNGTSGKWENASVGSSSHTYSTTEQVVGTWIDGKPIYEVTFTQVTQNIASGSMVELADLSSLAIDNVVSVSGGVWYETGTAADKRYLSLGDYCGIEYGDSTGKAYGRQSFTGATTNRTWTWNGTIRYTKTTDVAP